MAKFVEVVLGGVTYQVPKPNVGQLKELTAVFMGPSQEVAYEVLRVAFERVEPKVNVFELDAEFDEVSAAAGAILTAAGLKKVGDGKSPNPQPEASG